MSDGGIRSGLAQLAGDADARRDWAQLDARAALTELLGEAPQYHWTYIPARLIRNATAALIDLRSLSLDDPAQAASFSDIGRRIARTWESLAILKERTSADHATLMAALGYELSGYQANSLSLARRLSRLPRFEDRPLVERLTVAFLQRLFLRSRIDAEEALKEPLQVTLVDARLAAIASTGLMAAALIEASQYFLSGDPRKLDSGIELMAAAEEGYSQLGLVSESNAAFALRGVLPMMASRSIWTLLGHRLPDSPLWRRYLQLLARGPGSRPIDSTSVSELWPSQIEALNHGLFDDRSAKIVRMPTSAGKTRVAELAVVHTLVNHPGSRCVYVAPYRALVSEVQQTLSDLFADLGFRVPLVLGSYETDELEETLATDADVLVVTPEKLDLILRLQPDVASSIRLLILDEGHIIDQIDRGAKFELLLTRLNQQLPDARVIVLSAVVPNQTLEDFANWFGATEDGIIQSEWRPTRQRVALFEWRGSTGVLDYSPTPDDPSVPGFVPGIIRPNVYEFINPETLRTNRRTFPEPANKSHTAAELAYKFAEIGPVLVFCSQTNFVLAVGKALLARFSYRTLITEARPVYLDTTASRSAAVSREWLGAEHVITQLLENGVAVHHGGLPDALRKSVEDDFRHRRYRILLATNTLAQGVNLPLRTVVFHSCWRTAANENPQRILARDYWNIAGRAGRAREETEGTVVHIALSTNDRRDYRYYLDRRASVEAVESALLKLLRLLVQRRVEEGAALDYVDPEILALVVEEKSANDLDHQLQSLIDGSLVRIQAEREGLSLEPLRRVLSRSAAAIIARAPSPALLPTFAKTGLSSQSCLTIYQAAESGGGRMRELLRTASPASIMALTRELTETCLELSEMTTERAFGGSVTQLLERWMSGVSTDELRTEFGAEASSPEELCRFIDDVFAYRLPWGLSSYLRIAGAALELPRSEMSLVARFLPAMVKFGVPSPQAAWALTQGIPLRSVAIRLADRYVATAGDSSDVSSFRRWLSQIEIGDLVSEFQLRGELLEGFMRSVATVSTNPLLRNFRGVGALLPMRASVRGVALGRRSAVASEIRPGDAVTLVRDHDNAVDRNAIEVAFRGAGFGYLPRNEAQLLAPEVDCGARFQCIAVGVALQPELSITVEISTA